MYGHSDRAGAYKAAHTNRCCCPFATWVVGVSNKKAVLKRTAFIKPVTRPNLKALFAPAAWYFVAQQWALVTTKPSGRLQTYAI